MTHDRYGYTLAEIADHLGGALLDGEQGGEEVVGKLSKKDLDAWSSAGWALAHQPRCGLAIWSEDVNG